MNQFTCLSCGNVFVPKSYGNKNIYCSNACQAEHRYENNIKEWLSGNLVGWKGKTKQLKNFVRKYLHSVRGTQCENCGWDKRHTDGSILTEIDHIDGDAENCTLDNLRILCPNCHSLTPTFKNRNVNSKRER